MSESGESQPQDDSDEDIYKDFADFNFGDELAKLEHSKETIKKEALDLSEQIKVLRKENEELRKSNEILKKNMSSLLKTAQAEIQRKDSMIQELRNKLDSFTFRRKNKITKDIFTSTQDLEITVKMKNGPAENVNDKKRSKSKECRSSSEGEKKSYGNKDQKKKESEDEREDINCDNNRKYGYYRDCTRRKSRHSDRHYKPNDKKESHFRENSKKDEPDYRGPITDNHKGHFKYHSLDKRKRSRSSDRRFTHRRRNLRPRRSERLEENSEKWRREKKDVSEYIKRRRHSRKDKSRSRECSRGSKESSLDPPKSRSSSDKDSGSRNKESSNKSKEINSVKMDSDESKKGKGYFDKEKNEVKPSVKAKGISKEENSGKNEKPSEIDKFSTKSPLDALYNEMLTSRSANRFSKLGSGVTKAEPDLEESKFAKIAQQECSHVEEEVEEDWTLSFKNERRDKTRPMTLYSKRMLQKLTEPKETERLSTEEKTVAQDATLKETKKTETEKEPGELTDDESVIENSKEFRELTKVASIESLTMEKPKESELFKEPIAKEPLIVKKPGIESKVEEPDSSNEVQREIRNVIEYSPFKNNYKLIEISPIKPPDKDQITELHHKKTSTGQLQKEVESSIFNLLSSLSGVPVSSKVEAKETRAEEFKQVEGDSEKNPENKTEPLQNEKSYEKTEFKSGSRKNSKSKKSDIKKPEKKVKSIGEENKSKKSDDAPGDATQFLDFFLLTTSPSKPVIPEQPETPGKTEKATNLSDPKSDTTNSSAENVEIKIPKSPKKGNTKTEEERKKTKKESEKTAQKKQDLSKDIKKVIPKKENENKPNSKIQKRKRDNESEPEPKKPRLDESPRKRTRSQQNSGSKTDKPKPESETESETKVNEDITTFEFFKPIAKKDTLDTSTECKMAMSVANIVCLETPNKGVANLKNLMINEQMILNYLDSKNPAMCSPLMTPRRLLKNDLMLTDSEDDSGNKGNVEEEEGDEISESENSECESDSGASDFVDLL